MSDVTLDTIRNAYKEFGEGDSFCEYSFVDCLIESWGRDEFREKHGVECLDKEGGGEGGGEYCYAVFTFEGHTYKIEYSYYSYHGCNYDCIDDNFCEVKAKEKTVTVYE